MNRKCVGFAFIVLGIALIVTGYKRCDSTRSHISRVCRGDASIDAWIGIAGGSVCLVIAIVEIR